MLPGRTIGYSVIMSRWDGVIGMGTYDAHLTRMVVSEFSADAEYVGVAGFGDAGLVRALFVRRTVGNPGVVESLADSVDWQYVTDKLAWNGSE